MAKSKTVGNTEEAKGQSTADSSVRGITAIAVEGYKAIAESCRIEVRPLTILAGANSSGKSSIMQPLLLMKQTLEATYDPGALLLNDQLVYIEQPEIHLHPRAQVAMAEILAEAANRGIRVVIETHSELLLLSIQSLVAEGKLPSELVKLHWFTRREDGITQVTSADLDKAGAFGEWPVDFSDVAMTLDSRYLGAAEAHLWAQANGKTNGKKNHQ